jgi:RNA polymerase sigma-70 factor, ECF subfamily
MIDRVEGTDEDLLQRLALKRDEAAFSELVSRMNQMAYCLALHITGSACQADESVQEGMVAVWMSSAKIDSPVTNARAWILTIVARQAFKVNRRKRKSERREVPIDACLLSQERSEPAAAELIAALRRNLLALEEKDRQLMALYFDGGLSQMEISRELAIPQRTISHRINRVLRHLRGALLGAGVAAIIPLDRTLLQSALQNGQAAPAASVTDLLLKIKGAESLRWIPPLKAAISGKVAASSAVAASLFLAIAIGFFSQRAPEMHGESVESAQLESVSRLVSGTAPLIMSSRSALESADPPTAKQPFSFRWRFPEDYALDEFTVVKGNVRCEAQGIRLDRYTHVVIKKTLPTEPVLLTADISNHGGGIPGTFGVRAITQDGDQSFASHAWILKSKVFFDRRFTAKTYFVNNAAYVFLGGKLAVVSKYRTRDTQLYLRIEAGNVVCHSLQLETIQHDALPPELSRPIEELTRGMTLYTDQ